MTARQRRRLRRASDLRVERFRRPQLRFELLESRQLLSGVPVGTEFRVNTYTPDSQSVPAVARDSDGDFVVVWASQDQEGTPGFGIYAQRFAADGMALGAEFRVNTYTTDIQFNPSVAMDSDGDFVIAWQSKGQDTGTTYGVYAQRYNSGGVAQGGEFRVNTVTANDQFAPSVAMDADGDFAVVWSSQLQDGDDLGVYAQRYNAAGVAQGANFKVNTHITDNQRALAVAMDATGRFVVIWRSGSTTQDGGGYGIYAQRYNAAGTAQGTEFRVNTHTTGHQFAGDVAMDADGDFVVVWDSASQDPGGSSGIYAKRYNASGVAQGSEFRVNSYTPGLQFAPTVAMDAGGDFVVAWTSYYQDGDAGGIYAQRYAATGAALDPEFRVNTQIGGGQNSAAVAMDADDKFVVVWNSNGQDLSAGGIYAKRLGTPPGDLDGDNDVDADDIDVLCQLIDMGDPAGNLDGNGFTNQDDMDYMISQILGTTYGDADLDGDVDGVDFDAWRLRDSLGGSIGWATGDFDCDGDVDGADFDLWRLRPTAITGGDAEAASQSIALTGGPAVAPAQLAEQPTSAAESPAVIAGGQLARESGDSARNIKLAPTTDDMRDNSLYRSRHFRRGVGLPAAEALEKVFAAWGLPR